jgi:hypothetical protein
MSPKFEIRVRIYYFYYHCLVISIRDPHVVIIDIDGSIICVNAFAVAGAATVAAAANARAIVQIR